LVEKNAKKERNIYNCASPSLFTAISKSK